MTDAKTAIQRPHVIIYTDGACKGNPGPGGWGAWLHSGGHEKELWGGERLTTNNRMELTAVIRALATLKRPCAVTIVTDSEYVKNGITTSISASVSAERLFAGSCSWRKITEMPYIALYQAMRCALSQSLTLTSLRSLLRLTVIGTGAKRNSLASCSSRNRRSDARPASRAARCG